MTGVECSRRAFLRFLAASPLFASLDLTGCEDRVGLAAFGRAGVERALDILRRELEITMGLAGTPSIRDIVPASIGP